MLSRAELMISHLTNRTETTSMKTVKAKTFSQQAFHTGTIISGLFFQHTPASKYIYIKC